jgi:tRNA-2-methylthio-N6-dimethylallyladenosine synthase
MRPNPYQAYLRIQIGCDKFCTYCIVPMVRGPEQGRSPDQIVAEARVLADQGCLEVTLLGQTVNSYRFVEGDRATRLSDLLYRLHDIEGLKRLKFVTNYPKDMTGDLLQAVRDLPKCSPYLHVPAQSGSNRILARMKRGYTVEDYQDMFDRIRHVLPEAAVSSDFIVGFCGETEEDFQQTVALVRRCRFKNSFIFKYSERPGTKGAELLVDDVPMETKRRRNRELLTLQNQISQEDNDHLIGRAMRVLVEGPSKAAANARQELSAGSGELARDFLAPMGSAAESELVQMCGRTHCDRIVVFEGNRRQAGQILPVTIYDASSHTLFGAVVTGHVTSSEVQLHRPSWVS